MRIEKQDHGDVCELALQGQLDAMSAPNLKLEAERLVTEEGRTQFVINLSGVDLMDSSGVGAIVSLFKRARTQGGDVKIAGMRGQPQEILKLLKLDRAFDTTESIEDAVQRFRA